MDTRTIFQISAIVSASIFALLVLIHVASPALRGIRSVCCGFACSAIGMGLVSFRGLIPNILSITLAHIVLILINVFFYRGLVQLLRLHRHVLWLGLVSVLPILTWNVWFTFYHPSQVARILANSLILAFQNILLAALVTKHGPPATRIPRFSMAVLFYFWAAANLLDIGTTLVQRPHSLFPVAGSLNALIVLVPVLDSIITVIAFLWLSMSTLQFNLETQVRTDSLTGLPDRRAMELTGAREIARARRAGAPLSTILLDFDSFQSINDHYGHDTGDFALNIAANYLTDSLRNIDLMARFSGEKFVIFLPETVGVVASEVAGRLRHSLSQLLIRHNNNEFYLSASFGVTELSNDDLTWEDMLLRADRALHRAKDEGRNRTVTI